MAEEKKTVILDFQVDSDDATVSIQKLTAANKALREERKKVDLSTEEGIKRVKDINKAIDENDKVIKNNSSNLEKQRLNVGNYSGALDKLIPGLGATAQGFLGVGKAIVTALVANPVGVIIAGIVAGIALLIKVFTGGEAGGDMFAKKMAQISAIFNVIIDRAAQLGGALVKLFSGDFSGAFEDASDAVSGLTDEMAREVQIAGELADILDELGNREVDYKVAASETELQIKRLILESKNRILTEEERIQKLKEAADLEIKQNEVIKKINQDKLNYAIRELEMNNSQLKLQRQKDESELDYAKRLASNRAVKFADIEKVSAAIIELNKTEGDSLNLQEKINNQIDAQNLKQQEKAEKLRLVRERQEELIAKEAEQVEKSLEQSEILEERLDEAREMRAQKETDAKAKESMDIAQLYLKKKQADEEYHKLVNRLGDQTLRAKLSRSQEEIQDFLKRYQTEIQQIQAVGQTVSYIYQGMTDLRKKEAEIQLQDNKIAQNAELKALQDKLDAGEISEEQYKNDKLNLERRYKAEEDRIKERAFEADKKNRITQSIIDAVQSGLAAFRALVGIPVVGPILGAAAAGAALGFGYRQVELIKKEKYIPAGGFKQGGYTGDGNPDDVAGVTHRGEFVMPANVVSQFGKETFQSFMDGSVVANGRTGGMKPQQQMEKPVVYLNYTEFRKFQDEVQMKEAVTTT